MKWKYARRRINGSKGKRKCKVHKKANGGELVRLVGHRNYRD